MQKLGTRLARYWNLGWMVVWGLGALGFGSVLAQPNGPRDAWVETTLRQLTLRQKIGQLIMVPVFAQADTADAQVLGLLWDYEVGGLIWMKGKSGKLTSLLQHYKKQYPNIIIYKKTEEEATRFILHTRTEFNKHIKLWEAEPRRYEILSAELEPEHIKQIRQNIKAMEAEVV